MPCSGFPQLGRQPVNPFARARHGFHQEGANLERTVELGHAPTIVKNCPSELRYVVATH